MYLLSNMPTLGTKWAPTSYRWSYNPYKWPYKWQLQLYFTLLTTGFGVPLCIYSSNFSEVCF